MIIGKRDETLQEKNLRHITEMRADIQGWESELDYAKEKSDEMYEKYCYEMIIICQNTLSRLEELANEYFR